MILLDAFIHGPDFGPHGKGWLGENCCSPSCSPPDTVCQCVALGAEWCCANHRPNPSGPSAAELVFPPGWRQVPLSAGAAGDLVQWSAGLPNSEGHGHLAIYKAKLSTGFQSFDQNWTQDLCELVAHDPSYVKAVWRWQPDVPPQPPAQPGNYPDGPSWPLGAPDLSGVEL